MRLCLPLEGRFSSRAQWAMQADETPKVGCRSSRREWSSFAFAFMMEFLYPKKDATRNHEGIRFPTANMDVIAEKRLTKDWEETTRWHMIFPFMWI